MSSVREPFHPKATDLDPARIFYALSDQIRLDILLRLEENSELSCGTIVTGLPKSTMSHHFKVLREAGLIRTRIEGTQRYMSLRRVDLEARFPGLLEVALSTVRRSRGRNRSSKPSDVK